MNDFKSRMLEEHNQLIDRIVKLKAFLWQDLFNGLPSDDKTLLIQQLAHMTAYENVLATRISKA